MKRTLLDLEIGQEGIVKDFEEASLACKLLTIGIVPDTKISLVRRAPFGGAVCLRLGQTFVAVRDSEAKAIILQ